MIAISRRFSFRLPSAAWFCCAFLGASIASLAILVALSIRREHAMIREIEGMGGAVERVSGGPVWLEDLLGRGALPIFDRIERVLVPNVEITDEWLLRIRNFRHIEVLMLDGTQITDERLAVLENMTNLRAISLCGTPISDAALLTVKNFKNLERLGLSETAVTDAGLAHLAGLSRLRSLALENTRIGDAGLVHLRALKALESLALKNTNVHEHAGLSNEAVTLLKSPNPQRQVPD